MGWMRRRGGPVSVSSPLGPSCLWCLAVREKPAVDQENVGQVGDAGSNGGFCLSWSAFCSPFRTQELSTSLHWHDWFELPRVSTDEDTPVTAHLGVPREFRAALRNLVG